MDSLIRNQQLYKTYTIEHIFRDALYNQLELTPELEDYLESEYQISIYSTFLIVGIWLGKSYTDDWQKVRDGLESFNADELNINLHKQVLCLPMQKLVLCIFFPMINRKKYHYFQRKIYNSWSLFAPEYSVFLMERCAGLLNFPHTYETIMSQLDWNLVVGPKVLISSEKVQKLHLTPLPYLSELDGEVEKALLHKNKIEFIHCFNKLHDYTRSEIHTPEAVKSVCLRYALTIAHIARVNEFKHSEIEVQHLMKVIVNACYWSEIRNVILDFSIDMLSTSELDKKQSLLIIEAKQLMRQYYCLGITLEEIADKLHVSEEYLSTIFKKETGASFSETIRTYRINHAKLLLKTSKLKINDIAHLSGYSDGKYMSRVFKEYTGLSPNEYRKMRAD